jgi:hypothetical protein
LVIIARVCLYEEVPRCNMSGVGSRENHIGVTPRNVVTYTAVGSFAEPDGDDVIAIIFLRKLSRE